MFEAKLSPQLFGSMIDPLSISLLGRQITGSYIACVNGVTAHSPPLLSPSLAGYLRRNLDMLSLENEESKFPASLPELRYFSA